MTGRTPREARVLGLWTAGWLALLLLIGLAWVGNWRVEWPVLLVPLVWALVALARGRRGGRRGGRHREVPGALDDPDDPDDPDGWGRREG